MALDKRSSPNKLGGSHWHMCGYSHPWWDRLMVARSVVWQGFVAVFLAFFCSAAPARAALILSNAPAANDLAVYTFGSEAFYSIGFTVGATPITLSDVTLRLGAINNPISVSMYLGTSAGTTGTAVASQAVTGTGVQSYQFNFSSGVLAANSTYWISVTPNAAPPGEGLKLAGNDPSQTPATTAFASYAGLQAGVAPGGPFLPLPLTDVPTIVINGSAVAAVPEPSSLAIIALTVAGMGAKLRRRKQALVIDPAAR